MDLDVRGHSVLVMRPENACPKARSMTSEPRAHIFLAGVLASPSFSAFTSMTCSLLDKIYISTENIQDHHYSGSDALAVSTRRQIHSWNASLPMYITRNTPLSRTQSKVTEHPCIYRHVRDWRAGIHVRTDCELNLRLQGLDESCDG